MPRKDIAPPQSATADRSKENVGGRFYAFTAPYTTRAPKVVAPKQNASSKFVYFGDDNLYPASLVDYRDNSPTHGSCLNKTAEFVAGNGYTVTIDGKEDEAAIEALKDLCKAGMHSFVADPVQEVVKRVADDLTLGNGYSVEVQWDGEQMSAIAHHDWTMARCAQRDPETGKIPTYFLSSDWFEATKRPDEKEKFWKIIPFDAFNPDEKSEKQMIYAHHYKAGKRYYPEPRYMQITNSIEIEATAVESDKDDLDGNFTGSVHVHIEAQIEPEKASELKNDIVEEYTNGSGPQGGNRIFVTIGPSQVSLTPIEAPDIGTRTADVIARHERKILTGWGVRPEIAGIFVASGLQSESTAIQNAFTLYMEQTVNKLTVRIEELFTMLLHYAGYEGRKFEIKRPRLSLVPDTELVKIGNTINEIRTKHLNSDPLETGGDVMPETKKEGKNGN